MDLASTNARHHIIGRSGALGPLNEVDPWSHFINVYMLDKDGNRIDRRNPQDIFTPLYNHQIPPGAATVVHYKLHVPEDSGRAAGCRFESAVSEVRHEIYADRFGKDHVNDLPVVTIAFRPCGLPNRFGRFTNTGPDDRSLRHNYAGHKRIP